MKLDGTVFFFNSLGVIWPPQSGYSRSMVDCNLDVLSSNKFASLQVSRVKDIRMKYMRINL